MDITCSIHFELPAEQKQQIEAVVQAEFSQFAIVRETRWATPEWTILAFEDEELAAFYNLVERTVHIDGIAVRVAGLNNLMTLPAHRGRGLGARLLRETQEHWFDSLGAECGLLLCADALLPFYSRLDWRRAEARVSYTQPCGPRTWAANCMLLDPLGKVGAAREIDLCGLPW